MIPVLYLTYYVTDLIVRCTAGFRCGILQCLFHHCLKYESEKVDLAVLARII